MYNMQKNLIKCSFTNYVKESRVRIIFIVLMFMMNINGNKIIIVHLFEKYFIKYISFRIRSQYIMYEEEKKQL